MTYLSFEKGGGKRRKGKWFKEKKKRVWILFLNC